MCGWVFLTNFALQAATLAAPMPRIRRTKGGNRAAKHIAYINISVVLGGLQGGNRATKPCKGAIYKPRVLTLGADETREHYI